MVKSKSQIALMTEGDKDNFSIPRTDDPRWSTLMIAVSYVDEKPSRPGLLRKSLLFGKTDGNMP
jgi:hypothetical protein